MELYVPLIVYDYNIIEFINIFSIVLYGGAQFCDIN